ncbi:hypothetical protein BaRGS_00009084 [Batillaria attramentaria]|uniref:Uncharacterized protein n=1 Tax=Batillaria attramentaria TaxID=370345 RepID=A0ABD0LKW2_9CAEN
MRFGKSPRFAKPSKWGGKRPSTVGDKRCLAIKHNGTSEAKDSLVAGRSRFSLNASIHQGLVPSQSGISKFPTCIRVGADNGLGLAA